MNFLKWLKNKYYSDFLIFAVFMLFAGYLSVSYGMERMYDTTNYHIYNPYAFLTGRIGYDVMPAGIQSYFNPFLDIPYYLAIKYLNDYPTVITFSMGFSYAFFLFMVYKISFFVFKNYHPKVMAVICIFLASGNVINLRCIGWLSHDLFLGDMALLSIYLIFKSMAKHSLFNFGLSGLILGLIVGLKYTTVIFAIPMVIMLLLFNRSFEKPLKSLLLFAVCGAFGFLITGGIWMYELYCVFANPLYPYFGWLFPTPDIAADDVFSTDFGRVVRQNPKGKWGIKMLYSPLEVRFKILQIAFIINFVLFLFVNKEKFRKWFLVEAKYADFMLLFCFGAYVLWAHLFNTLRYYSPLLGITVIVAVIALFKVLYVLRVLFAFLSKNKIKLEKIFKVMTNSAVACFMVYLLFLLWPNYTRFEEKKLIRVSVGEKILTVEDLKIPDGALVLLTEGTGIILPFNNPKAKYVRLNPAEFTKKGKTLFSDIKINEIKAEIRKKRDKIYLIATYDFNNYMNLHFDEVFQRQQNASKKGQKALPRSIREADLSALDSLGLKLKKNNDCRRIETNMINTELNMGFWFDFCKI